MKVYFVSNVTLGYGNPEYINLANELFKKKNQQIHFIEPIDKDRPFYNLPHDFIKREKMLLSLGNLLRKFPGGITSKALTKLASTAGVTWQIILFLADKNKKLLITSRYHPLLSLTPRRVKIYFYCSEVFEVENNSGLLFENFKKKVSAVIAPQTDRLEYLKKIFPASTYHLVQNCPPTQDQTKKPKHDNKNIIYQGRVGKLSNANEIIMLAKNAPSNFKVHVAGPIDKEFLNEITELHKKGKLTYHGYLSSDELYKLREKMAYGLVTWGNHDLNTKYCAPNKLYEYIAEGIVVVAFDNYSVNNLNSLYNFGFVSKDGHKSVIKFIESISEEEYATYSSRNLETHYSELNFETQSKELVEDIIHEISIP